MTIEEAIDIIETSTYLWLRTTDLERTALSMALEALADRKTENSSERPNNCDRKE